MTSYLTNTITTCQEFTASPVTNLRRSCNFTERRDFCKRLSITSSNRVVVEPMVGDHITKPTINLKRVNIQHFSNPPNLSIIQEVATLPRNRELTTSRPPSAAVRVRLQDRYENGRACRRLVILSAVSPRNLFDEHYIEPFCFHCYAYIYQTNYRCLPMTYMLRYSISSIIRLPLVLLFTRCTFCAYI